MMIKKQLICLILFITIFNSCKKTKPEANPFIFDDKESRVYELTSQKIIDENMLYPDKIVKKGDFLIVTEDTKTSFEKPLIHLLDLKTLKYLRPKGKNGMGPNEITDAHLIDLGDSDSTFWVNSVMSKRMAEFSLYDSSLLSINEFKPPGKMMIAYKMYKKTDSTFLCITTTDEGMFNEYDMDGNKVASYHQWPDMPDDKRLNRFSPSERTFLLSHISSGKFRKDHHKGLFALAMTYRDRIVIFDSKSEEVMVIKGGLRTETASYEIGGTGINIGATYGFDVKYGHRDIAFGEKYIYDLYGGYSEIDFRKTAKLAETIFLISRSGKVLARFNLDCSVKSITVDEKLGKIYGITTDKEPGIAVFDIPEEFLD